MNYELDDRFELLTFETAAEYLERREKELEILRNFKIKIDIQKLSTATKGICKCCETNNKKKIMRWIEDIYMCYDCFIEGLECQADVMVPMRRACDLEEYMTEGEWEEAFYEEAYAHFVDIY